MVFDIDGSISDAHTLSLASASHYTFNYASLPWNLMPLPCYTSCHNPLRCLPLPFKISESVICVAGSLGPVRDCGLCKKTSINDSFGEDLVELCPVVRSYMAR